MNELGSPPAGPSMEPPPIRWWPAVLIVVLVVGAVVWIRLQDQLPFQQRNLRSFGAALVGFGLLLLWWAAFSRARWRLRLSVLGIVGVALAGCAGIFRIRGVDGDLVPILEPRWVQRTPPPPATKALVKALEPGVQTPSPNVANAVPGPAMKVNGPEDFPQFLGPDRTSVLTKPVLAFDWKLHPPRLRWKQPIGAGWSGFVLVGGRAITQEQAGEEERVTCYDVATGRLLWQHADAARYQTTIAGEGPRATPTVVSNRVYALGGTGILNCLDLADGRRIWQRIITTDAHSAVPDWGFSGAPLVMNGRVHVSAGGKPDRSLIAYRADKGEIAWTAGGASASYSSPFPATLAGRAQILMFNSRRITAHAAGDGSVLWEYPWGVGQPHVAVPVIVGTDRVVFSSGYGVGAELLEIVPGTNTVLAARRVWKSNRMKAKFSNPVARDGFLYGLDDGVLACVDLKDGSQRWKEGRYGHGQGLLVGDLYLLMAESGELVLLRPTPTGPNELGRFPVFSDKTWNPIALSGSRLLVRNDREAACLELELQP